MDFKATWSELIRRMVQWVGITAFGGVIAYFTILILANAFSIGQPGAWSWVAFVGGIAGGGVAGLGQWQLLRDVVEMPVHWVWTTALGWGVSLPLLVFGSARLSQATGQLTVTKALLVLLAGAAAAGLLAGVGQWLLLRRRLKRAAWWLVGSALGWQLAWVTTLAFAWMVMGTAALPIAMTNLVGALFLGAVAGGMVGLEQGVALVGLLAQVVLKSGGTPPESLQH